MKVGKKFHLSCVQKSMTWISVQLYTIITLIDILSYYQKYICKKKNALEETSATSACHSGLLHRKYEIKKNEMLSNNYNLNIFHCLSSCNFIQQFVVERFPHF